MPNRTVQTDKQGYALIRDPLLNKGSAFTADERDAFRLHGLLPPQTNTQTQQAQRAFGVIRKLTKPLEKYVSLTALQDRNEHLFYRVLMDHLEELMPIVYTPTVGLATQNFSQVFQRGRGIWINPDMTGHMEEVLRTAVGDRTIRLIVATDNESILGIGDQGAGGMAISVGKLALYVAGAGIHPAATLPISLDVGTNNQARLDDDLYLGWRQPRLQGNDYEAFIDEFVQAVRAVFPQALLQWEDFRKDNALRLMEKHRNHILSFNDDIQGTGAVALAGIFSALKITGQRLADSRVLIHGAGAAGIGISRQIRVALESAGVDEPIRCLGVLDSRGLIVDDHPFSDAYKAEMAWPAELAASFGMGERGVRELAGAVNAYRPNILIGASGQSQAFSRQIVTAMGSHTERPIILPFSNPTDHAEAVPADVIAWSEGRALIATGSPFDPVVYQGKTHKIGQGNNVFIFPGLGLGALVSNATGISDTMVTAAARACAESLTRDELDQGLLFPEVSRLRAVTMNVARAVAHEAIAAGATQSTAEQVEAALVGEVWDPDYPILEPNGV